MQHHMKDAISVIVTAMVMNNWVFVIQIRENVIVNIIPKETIANFAKKDFLEIRSNNYFQIIIKSHYIRIFLFYYLK